MENWRREFGRKSITSATLTFRNISNWDRNPNMLFIHLLDTVRNAGASSFQDAPANQAPVTDINDDFAGERYLRNPLVAPGTANTFLTQQSFTTSPRNFVYTFTADQLRILSAYFLNGGDIAFGLDSDCHFWNDGIVFSFTTTPNAVPEPTTLALLGSGLAGLYYARRRKKQQGANYQLSYRSRFVKNKKPRKRSAAFCVFLTLSPSRRGKKKSSQSSFQIVITQTAIEC